MELGLKGRRALITGRVARYRLRRGGGLSRGRLFGRHRIQERGETSIRRGTPVEIRARQGPWKSHRPVASRRRGCAGRCLQRYGHSHQQRGAIPSGDIFEVDEARWRAAWDLKVFGYINLTRAMFAHMRGHPPKVILNVIGMGAERPQWRYVCGNAANVALNGVTKSLGGRSLDHGVRVLGVNPGAVETERVRTLLQSRAEKMFGDASRWRDVMASTQPHGRAATTKEIADVVVFLASDRAAWICGEVVNVDAGNIYRQDLF